MNIANMKILELVREYVPAGALDPAELERAKEMQALLLAAHENDVDNGKDVFERLRNGDRKKLEADLLSAGIDPAEALAQNINRIGQEIIPAEVPAIAQIARIPQDVKNALLLLQAVARLETLDTTPPTFQEPRIFDNDPEILQMAQRCLLAHMKEGGSRPSRTTMHFLNRQAVSEINGIWESEYGQPLLQRAVPDQPLQPITKTLK